MKRLYRIAIVGRPNVGKSAIFNRICRKRIAIVDEAEGITRDRLYTQVEYDEREFELIDTGGIDPKSKLPFNTEVQEQAAIGAAEADVLIMVVDSKVGVTALDKMVAQKMLRLKKPIVLAVNKIDAQEHEHRMHPFCSLGIKKMIPVSASHGHGIEDVIEECLKGYRPPEEDGVREPLKMAILGRPNVGKSTLINALAGEDRCCVSPEAGTTRDSVDIPIEVDGEKYILIDTAGIRRKKAEHDVVDKFAAIRTERAIERADVCFLMLDSTTGISAQEKRIASLIFESGKPCIILFNKWDLIKDMQMETGKRAALEEHPVFKNYPMMFVSAKTGRNIIELFQQAERAYAAASRRISTGELNAFVAKAIQSYHPPMLQGKRLRIYYMTQVETNPPVFVLFVNNPKLMAPSYERYLMNTFRKEYGFSGSPIQFELRAKAEQTKPGSTTPAASDDVKTPIKKGAKGLGPLTLDLDRDYDEEDEIEVDMAQEEEYQEEYEYN